MEILISLDLEMRPVILARRPSNASFLCPRQTCFVLAAVQADSALWSLSALFVVCTYKYRYKQASRSLVIKRIAINDLTNSPHFITSS